MYLIGNPEFADVQAELDAELQRQLEQNNDSLMTAEAALEKWGYVIDKVGQIPYGGEFKVQSPGPDGGETIIV